MLNRPNDVILRQPMLDQDLIPHLSSHGEGHLLKLLLVLGLGDLLLELDVSLGIHLKHFAVYLLVLFLCQGKLLRGVKLISRLFVNVFDFFLVVS